MVDESCFCLSLAHLTISARMQLYCRSAQVSQILYFVFSAYVAWSSG